MTFLNRSNFQAHPFHLVDQSPWPFLISWTLFFMAVGAVLSMHGFLNGGLLLSIGFILTVFVMNFWLGDVNTEATYLGNHTKEVKNGLIFGFILFVISEGFAFLSVFWAYFHSSIVPSVEIGGYWPPLGITPLDPFSIPVRPLINIMPVALTTITKLTLCKSTDLPIIEMRRGVEHVCEVEKQNSYNFVIGEIIFIHGLIIHRTQDGRLNLKVTDTNLFNFTIEKVYVVKSLLNRTYTRSVKMKPKDRISDIILGTGDRLREVIPMLELEANNILSIGCGDGVTVVPKVKFNLSKERVTGNLINKVPASVNSRRSPLLITKKGADYRPYSLKQALTKNPRYYTMLQANTGVGCLPSYGGRQRYFSSQQLKDLNIYKEAYNKMKSNPGNMTKGTDGETLDGISINKLSKLRDSVMDWTFNFKPSRRIYIPKTNGKQRPLGIPNTMDKLLQIVLKDLMEEKFENTFHPSSFAFRKNKSIHHALDEARRMIGTSWIIEGDIKGYFDNIDHEILVKLIKERINPDQTIMNLIWKFMKAGYLEKDDNYKSSLIGVPQGGILSPMLSNLYLTPFDEFVDTLKIKFTQLPISKMNPEYLKYQTLIGNSRNKLKRSKVRTTEEILEIKNDIKKNGIILRTLPSSIKIGSRIFYVRYADDWIIGLVGPKSLAIEIKDLVKEFLSRELKLELSMEKTKITNIGSEYAKFLGHYIKVQTNSQNISSRRTDNKTGKTLNMRKATGKPKILVPKDHIKDKLIIKGFAQENGTPQKLNKWIYLPDQEIIQRFNGVLRGLMNFYNMAENRSSMKEAIYILKFSLAHTLAAKHRLSINKVFKKYGLRIKVIVNEKSIEFDEPLSLTAKYLNEKYFRLERKSKSGTPFDGSLAQEVIDPFNRLNYDIGPMNILDKPCLICDSRESIEMHHLRHLKDTKDKGTLIKIMSKIRRKVVPLCKTCHNNVHSGKYDGLNLKESRNKEN